MAGAGSDMDWSGAQEDTSGTECGACIFQTEVSGTHDAIPMDSRPSTGSVTI